MNETHHCTMFTTEHRLVAPEERDVFAAAVCPSCETPNPLTGEPFEFLDQPIRCMRCTRVMILNAAALERFVKEELPSSQGDQSRTYNEPNR